jgi:hypothetical protein
VGEQSLFYDCQLTLNFDSSNPGNSFRAEFWRVRDIPRIKRDDTKDDGTESRDPGGNMCRSTVTWNSSRGIICEVTVVIVQVNFSVHRMIGGRLNRGVKISVVGNFG